MHSSNSRARNAGSPERTLRGRCSVHTTTPAAPGNHGQQGLAARPKDGRPGEQEGLTPDAPHNCERSPSTGRPSATPAARNTPQGTHAKETVPGPRARTPAPTARGQRTPTTRPRDRQPGEDERLTSDAPHNAARHSLREHPLANPTAHNTGSQERTLSGRFCVPTPTAPAPGKHRHPSRLPTPGTAGQEGESA